MLILQRRRRTKAGASNLLVPSEDRSHGNWTKTNVVTSLQSVTVPGLGGVAVDKIVLNNLATVGDLRHQATASVVSGSEYTASFYFKADGLNQIEIDHSNADFGTASVHVNLDTGAIVSTGAATNSASIKPVGDGWYQVKISASAISTTTSGPILRYTAGMMFVGNGSNGVLMAAPQFSLGTFLPYYRAGT